MGNIIPAPASSDLSLSSSEMRREEKILLQ
jgi:hypothetical protein